MTPVRSGEGIGMADLITKTANRAIRMLLAAIPMLCVDSFCGPAEIGPADWLFQVTMKNRTGVSQSEGRQLLVLLPSADIHSRDELDKYLAWCGETHKSFNGSVRSCWDVDDIAFREPSSANLTEKMASFLRRGDSARDPSGVMSLTVTEVPKDDDDATFKLGLAERPLTSGRASPAFCLTNIWVLSRDELFARWEKDLEAGKGIEVFDEICRLEKSGRYRLSGGRAWEKAVRNFRKGHPSLRPHMVFRNESGKPIIVEVENQKMSPEIPSGHLRRFPPSGERRRIAWRVRPVDDSNLTDMDYEWASGSAYWDPEDTENIVVRLSPSSIGRVLEKWPKITITNTFNAVVHFSYEYEGRTNLSPADIQAFKKGYIPFDEGNDWTKQNEVDVVFVAESAEAERPWRRKVTLRRGQGPVTLAVELTRKDGAPVTASAATQAAAQKPPQKPAQKPPQKPAQKPPQTATQKPPQVPAQKPPQTPAQEPPQVPAPKPPQVPAPKPPQTTPQNSAPKPPPSGQRTSYRHTVPVGEKVAWPEKPRIDDLVNYFGNNACKAVMCCTKTDGDEFETLAKWQRFWKIGGTNELEKTFRDAVAHVASCNGCEACRERRSQHTSLGHADNPKEEIFQCMGSWATDNQRAFCKKLIEYGRYAKEDLKQDPAWWWKECKDAEENPAGENKRGELSRFWSGLPNRGTEFGRFYNNVELGNPDFERYRKAIEMLPTFEERRRELFRMVLLEERSAVWGEGGDAGVDKPSKWEVEEMVKQLDSISGKEEGK